MFKNPSMIWLIGKRGLLGSYFLSFLQKKGIPYVSTSFDEVDITKKSEVLSFAQNQSFTHIINCSAYTDVDGAQREKEKAYSLNFHALQNLALVKNAPKIIHFSTDYVFRGDEYGPYRETDPAVPINVYGESKLLGENFLLQNTPNSLIIRTSWLFGGKENFVEAIMRLVQTNTVLEVVSDQKGKGTFAKDLVEATFHLGEENGLFHFANSQEISRWELACLIQKNMQGKGKSVCHEIRPITSLHFLQKAPRPTSSILNTQKYEKVTKMIPRSIEESLKEYVDLKVLREV